MITVKRMPQTVRLDGRTYGPSETPTQVPEELARTLGLTPVEGDVLSDASEDELTEALSEAQDSARRYQNRLLGIEQLLRPAQQDESSPEEVIGRLLREIEEARVEPSLFEKTVTEEAKRLLAPLRRGEETLTQVLARVVQEAQHAAGQVAMLTSELDTLRQQALLPADALDRLKKVDGIGDKLAQKALDALTAQA
ncbi:hypothetical protein [Deinococcus seoulensis]|nr:hypothetical protein [Deinococcus seoulensis]